MGCPVGTKVDTTAEIPEDAESGVHVTSPYVPNRDGNDDLSQRQRLEKSPPRIRIPQSSQRAYVGICSVG